MCCIGKSQIHSGLSFIGLVINENCPFLKGVWLLPARTECGKMHPNTPASAKYRLTEFTKNIVASSTCGALAPVGRMPKHLPKIFNLFLYGLFPSLLNANHGVLDTIPLKLAATRVGRSVFFST